MNTKYAFAAVVALFCFGAYAEDIVYQNDWRAGETGYVTGDKVDNSNNQSGRIWTVPSIGYHTGQPYTRDDRTFPGRGWQENRDDRTFPGRGYQENRDDRAFSRREYQDNRDDRSFSRSGFQESRDDRW